ncbi:DUF309 domain-containing protein [Thermodesulfobacteriota bacterium]
MKKFDPFNNRLARNIRNGLSKSFLEALIERNLSLCKKRADGFLEQDLEQIYQVYIRTRLEKYDEIFAVVEQGQIDDELQQAEILWEYELYFEMHELLEDIWKNAEGNKRKALQGLIRAAGMKIHAENGNFKAAAAMGRKAQTALQLYGKVLIRFHKLESILAEIQNTLANMDISFQEY